MPAKKKVKKTESSAQTPAPAPEPTPPVAQMNSHEEPAPAVSVQPQDSLSDEFTELVSTLNALKATVTTLTARVKSLQKRTDKEMKLATKKKTRRGAKTADGKPRKPSGFVKPTEITSELAKFLGKSSGELMARTQVTREINQYIRQHNLQDPSNGRKINPDTKLRKLLNVPKTEELTYFNLQRYMSPHFVKTSTSTSSA